MMMIYAAGAGAALLRGAAALEAAAGAEEGDDAD